MPADAPATDGPPLPPGAARERTSLAWLRTAASMAVLALLILRAGLDADRPVVLVLGAGVLALAGGLCRLPPRPLSPDPHGGADAPSGPEEHRVGPGPAGAQRMALAAGACATASLASVAVLLLT